MSMRVLKLVTEKLLIIVQEKYKEELTRLFLTGEKEGHTHTLSRNNSIFWRKCKIWDNNKEQQRETQKGQYFS